MGTLMKRHRQLPLSFGDLPQYFNQLFDVGLYGNGPEFSVLNMSEWVPAIDISESDKEYTVQAVVPNVKSEDINITLNDNVLTVEGKTEEKLEEKEKNFIHAEIKRGSFTRSISLAKSVNEEGIKAKCKDGVLTITIPKAAKTKARQIKVD